MFKLLVIEDEEKLNQTMCIFLNRNGYTTIGVLNANDAYDKLYENTFDLIISDIMLPDIDGFEFTKTIRQTDKDIPILFVSALDDFDSKKKGFLNGIDDYMTKPINLDEMLLRIEALLRRSKIASSKKIEIGSLVLNQEEHTAYFDNEEVILTVREFDILYKLLSYPKKTFTRTQLMEEFWDIESQSGPRVVDVYITKIRDKFSECPYFEIQTIHGLGYKAVIK